MGMITDQKYPLKAKKDIKVFKVMWKVRRHQYKVCPPAIDNTLKYGLNEEYSTNSNDETINYHHEEIKKDGTKLQVIGKGFFHTFSTLDDAINFKNQLEEKGKTHSLFKKPYVILDSVIPKGSLYYKGPYKLCKSDTYASNKIRYLDEINFE